MPCTIHSCDAEGGRSDQPLKEAFVNLTLLVFGTIVIVSVGAMPDAASPDQLMLLTNTVPNPNVTESPPPDLRITIATCL